MCSRTHLYHSTEVTWLQLSPTGVPVAGFFSYVNSCVVTYTNSRVSFALLDAWLVLAWRGDAELLAAGLLDLGHNVTVVGLVGQGAVLKGAKGEDIHNVDCLLQGLLLVVD